ncbi:hypothetical protein FKM82_011064 [Ascaphus truei]
MKRACLITKSLSCFNHTNTDPQHLLEPHRIVGCYWGLILHWVKPSPLLPAHCLPLLQLCWHTDTDVSRGGILAP